MTLGTIAGHQADGDIPSTLVSVVGICAGVALASMAWEGGKKFVDRVMLSREEEMSR